MIWLSVILLAIIQGITEFLPVSSSGHLAVLGKLFGLESSESLGFGIVLHAGSLLAIVLFYFKTLIGFFKKDQLHLLCMVIIGSIPAGIAGVALKISGFDEKLFNDLASTGLAFLITAALLRLTAKEKLTANANTELKNITLKQSCLIGFTQMFAIIPGISRSGSTIACGILSGVKFEAAAAFSFLLALPAIGGASLLELKSLIENDFSLGEFSAIQLTAGFLISMLTSFGALTLLVALVKRKKLSVFSWYLALLGLAVVAWQLIEMNRR